MNWPDVIWGMITGALFLHACSLAYQHFTGYASPEFIVIEGDEMSKLSDLVAQAAEVAPRQSAKIEARARAIIEGEPALVTLQNESFGLHEAILAEAESTMHDLKHSLATLTNNPPSDPLGDFSGKPKEEPVEAPVPLQPGSVGAPESGR